MLRKVPSFAKSPASQSLLTLSNNKSNDRNVMAFLLKKGFITFDKYIS